MAVVLPVSRHVKRREPSCCDCGCYQPSINAGSAPPPCPINPYLAEVDRLREEVRIAERDKESCLHARKAALHKVAADADKLAKWWYADDLVPHSYHIERRLRVVRHSGGDGNRNLPCVEDEGRSYFECQLLQILCRDPVVLCLHVLQLGVLPEDMQRTQRGSARQLQPRGSSERLVKMTVGRDI